MNDLADFLARLTAILDELNVAYMVAGSFASTYYGVPRTTQDVDIVVELAAAVADALIARFPDERYYVSEDAVRDAVRRRSQFNIIDLATGWKADLIVRKDRPFSREELSRRQRARILGIDLWLASPEDTILSKLEWAKGTGSTRQLDDVRGIQAARAQELDTTYIDRWAAALGVTALWSGVRGDS